LFENVQRIDNPSMTNPKFEPVNFERIPEIVNIPSFETVPLSTPDDEPVTHDDISDTDADVSPKVEPVPPVKTAQQTDVPNTPNVPNTPFEQPIMVGGPKTREAKTEPGSIFVFDDDEDEE
jgi:hypothetical protein